MKHVRIRANGKGVRLSVGGTAGGDVPKSAEPARYRLPFMRRPREDPGFDLDPNG